MVQPGNKFTSESCTLIQDALLTDLPQRQLLSIFNFTLSCIRVCVLIHVTKGVSKNGILDVLPGVKEAQISSDRVKK